MIAFIAGVRGMSLQRRIFFSSTTHSFVDRSADLDKSSNTIITIKLSEKDETVFDQTGQSQQYFAETFFQMNTITGEWKRIKKLRPTNVMN